VGAGPTPFKLSRGLALLAGLLVVLAAVRLPGLFSRAIWYDEAITLLETAGNGAPEWPRIPAPASLAKEQFEGAPSLGWITLQLRYGDIHPPLYYWSLSLWRRGLGFSLETARAFSLLLSVSGALLLYLLLRAGRIPFPWIPTIVFGLTTFGVHMGHEARAYAFALLFILAAALFAFLSVDTGIDDKRRAAGLAALAGLCCGAALASNYLALFPVMAVLLWHLICAWRQSRWLALLPSLIAAAIGLLLLTLFSNQLGARPHQFAGRLGFLQEIWLLLWMNLADFHTSMIPSKPFQYLVWGILGFLVVFTLVQVARRWSTMERKEQRVLQLLLLLGLAPSAGIAVLNLLFDRHLSSLRYMAFALPGLAVAVSYGITSLMSSRRRFGVGLLVVLLVLQVSGVNWGLEQTPGQPDTTMRSLARAVEASPAPSRLAVVGAGYGRGHPGTVIYELDPETEVVVVYGDSDLDQLHDQASGYAEVCFFLSMEDLTSEVEHELLQRLRDEGRYTEVVYTGATLCLQQTN
jgi:hypothetical protein